MTIERDTAEFMGIVNEDVGDLNARLDGIINGMAEMRSEKNDMLRMVFERLGGIEGGIGKLAKGQESLDKRMLALEQRVALNQEGFQNDLHDVRRRVRKLENGGFDEDDEVTPRPAPSR